MNGSQTPTDSIPALAAKLRCDVETLAATIGPRHVWRIDALCAAEQFVCAAFSDAGYEVRPQRFEAAGQEVRNFEVVLPGAQRPEEIVIVGAHYDSKVFSTTNHRLLRETGQPQRDPESQAKDTPGANDNATGVAGLLALARAFAGQSPSRTICFVAFVNEEPPFFQGPEMGSVVYARNCRQRHENVVAIIALDTLGYYTSAPRSQRYPLPYSLWHPSTGNFVAFLSNLKSGPLLRRAAAAFRQHSDFPLWPARVPAVIPRIGWSDDWSFWRQGYPAIGVTDTAFLRYAHYHQPTDTADRIDFDSLARVVAGLEGMVADLANEMESR